MAPAERCSDDEDPFGHGGVLDAEEEERDKHKRNGYDSPEESHTNKLVLGKGVVHHSHETRMLRGITFCVEYRAWGSSAPRLLTKPCTYLADTLACDWRRLSRGHEPNRKTVWPTHTPLVPGRMYIKGSPEFDAEILRGVC